MKGSPKDLSDFQLYSLIMGSNLEHDLKSELEKEFKSRNFSFQQLDEMEMKLKPLNQTENQEGLSLSGKAIIIAIPFFILIHAIFANRHIKKGAQKKWRQYWNYIILGHFIWSILLMLIVKYYI
jgi:hypothetical protein